MYADEGQRRTTTRALEAATVDGEGFKGSDSEGFGGSDGKRRGLRRQRRQMARALKAATGDGTTSGRPDDNSQSQSQRRQRPQPPTYGAEISGSFSDLLWIRWPFSIADLDGDS
ncbi:hypothetical protein Scep_001413 [Stephania cephalantha]|uniref:Uncharacterized protein n=1 Tax=Stephania cephalantha TaxID=152367 RepID=A0AAP0Q3B8_9MAGN